MRRRREEGEEREREREREMRKRKRKKERHTEQKPHWLDYDFSHFVETLFSFSSFQTNKNLCESRLQPGERERREEKRTTNGEKENKRERRKEKIAKFGTQKTMGERLLWMESTRHINTSLFVPYMLFLSVMGEDRMRDRAREREREREGERAREREREGKR